MKGTLVYLTRKKLKNQIKIFLRSPAYIIYALFLVAMLVLSMYSGQNSGGNHSVRNPSELTAIIFALFTVMFAFTFSNGFSKGASVFTMSDVNMLFPSPISPKRILFYGLLRQLGMTLLIGFFILFQYSWLKNLYGVTFSGLLLILLGYSLTIFMAQVIAMALFIRTSGNEKLRKIIKMAVYALLLIIIVPAFINILQNYQGDMQNIFPIAVTYFNQPFILLFPVSGWISALIFGVSTQNMFYILGGIVLLIISSIVTVQLITTSKNNFYEDVIKSTEVAQSAISAKKEGKVGEVVPEKVKVGKIGIGKGSGASAIFYKHMIENRRSGHFMISNMSLIFVVCTLAFAFIMRSSLDGALMSVFAMSSYMQFFSVAFGRFSRELGKPQIYLIPESSFKKLLYSLSESLVSSIVEAIVIYIPLAFILSASPIDIFICIIARISFAMLFTAANVLLQRIFGGVTSKALTMTAYIFIIIILLLPGVILAVLTSISGFTLLTSLFLPFMLIAIANMLVSLLVLYLCRNVLLYAELNNQ